MSKQTGRTRFEQTTQYTTLEQVCREVDELEARAQRAEADRDYWRELVFALREERVVAATEFAVLAAAIAEIRDMCTVAMHPGVPVAPYTFVEMVLAKCAALRGGQ